MSIANLDSPEFREWRKQLKTATLDRQDILIQNQLVRTLVAGKALVHAIWTEADPDTASQLIETRLAPLVETQLELSQSNGGNVYKEELAVVVQPHLTNTELEFYTRKTTED